MKKTFVSFVVDKIPFHYYQAELLLFSLEHFALHPKENVVVQCMDGVNPEFITFLDTNGYNYTIISNYLYGKFCNKIQQLDFFDNESFVDVDIILVDTDTFFLKPINLPDTNKFAAKIVDGPNPSLQVIKSIFEMAQLSLPETVKTDWDTEDGETIATNFNGGFYFIPSRYVNTVNVAWKKWSQWLFTKVHEFNDGLVFIHLDQLSMALAINENKLDYINLATNFNCPTHRNTALRYYQKNEQISLIHYHKEINSFGFFNYENAANKKIEKSIHVANNKIIKECSFIFLEQLNEVLYTYDYLNSDERKNAQRILYHNE